MKNINNLGPVLDNDLDKLTGTDETDKFEVEIGKDIMTSGMYFATEGHWQEEDKTKLQIFQGVLSMVCITCQFLLFFFVFDEMLYFELGIVSKEAKIEYNTYENYQEIYCFSEIKENYESFDEEF